MLLIGVIGASYEDENRKLAYEVGRLIAEKGAVLVCGGLGGAMQYTCQGAKEMGGLTVGILPMDNTQDANPHVDIPIATGMGYARNVIIARTCDAAIAIGGRYGTLSEIAHVLNMGGKVFALNSWNVLEGHENFIVVKSPAEAVELAFKEAKSKENIRGESKC